MSGIVGILNLDGAPIDRIVLDRLTNALLFRGPDAQRTWFRGPIGFGHTLLCTTNDSGDEKQPLGLGGNTWIVADARIDGRHDLIRDLQSHGQQGIADAGDAELILRSYHVWGENCVEHLLGDFAFAIWDSSRRRLFCARDQMGVKPFFYAQIGPLFIFSNTLDCIRLHPAVSDRLNDLSIADFLVFDMIQDATATAFADIHRLPAAHALVCESPRLLVRRYWEPSAAPPVHYRQPADYVERFNELLDQSVADRFRADSACIFMSGGLDSPTVAASATRISAKSRRPCALWAYTMVFNTLIPDEERRYAGLAAQALKIPIEYHTDDNLRLLQFAKQSGFHSPEPVNAAWPDATVSELRRAATVSPVVLTGFGADPLFSTRISVHFRELLAQKRLGRALADALCYLTVEGRLSRLYLRTRWRILFAQTGAQGGSFPPWLNEDLTARLGLRERWDSYRNDRVAPEGAVRPEAYNTTFAALWPNLFESLDPGFTGVPVQVRHPFFDLRVINFVLGLPRLPWCSDKQLLREAGRGILPEPVRLRRKSPLAADPLLKLLAMPGAVEATRLDPVPQLERYVAPHRVPQVAGSKDTCAAWLHLRPLNLNYWLRGLYPSAIKSMGGIEHELSTL